MTTFFMILMKYCVHWTIIRETRFSQQYAALLQEQISKGLDLLLKKDIPQQIHVVPLFDPALYKKDTCHMDRINP